MATLRYVRARVVVLAETAPSAAGVARALGLHPQTVRDLLHAAAAGGLAALGARLGRPVSTEAVRRLLRRRRCPRQRAKEWVGSPDPRYAFKQSGAPACSPG